MTVTTKSPSDYRTLGEAEGPQQGCSDPLRPGTYTQGGLCYSGTRKTRAFLGHRASLYKTSEVNHEEQSSPGPNSSVYFLAFVKTIHLWRPSWHFPASPLPPPWDPASLAPKFSSSSILGQRLTLLRLLYVMQSFSGLV